MIKTHKYVFCLSRFCIRTSVDINKKNVACRSTNGVPEILYDKVEKLKLKIKALNLFIFKFKKKK